MPGSVHETSHLLISTHDRGVKEKPDHSFKISLFFAVCISIGVVCWTNTTPQHEGHTALDSTTNGDTLESDESNSPFYKKITYRDFLEHDKVLKFIESRGLSNASAEWELLEYLPKELLITGDPELIMGGGDQGYIGATAMEGLTTWSMQHKNTSGLYNSAFTIVLDMRGNIVSISPTMYHLADSYHFISWKPWHRDPNFMLGGVDIQAAQNGPVYLWNWNGEKDEEYISLMNGLQADCHDVSSTYTNDAIWVTADNRGVQMLNYTDGSIMKTRVFPKDIVRDPNHAQMIEHDRTGIISSRITNSIVKVPLLGDGVEWICGGKNGTIDIIDENGTYWPAGHTIWQGQHNVEYIGEQEYLLFDDQSSVSWDGVSESQTAEQSRLLLLRIDEKKKVAKIKWTYPVGAYTPIFGDADLMPTGNILGTMWVGSYNCTNWTSMVGCNNYPYDAQVTEVVKATSEVAWSVRIVGNESIKNHNAWFGWSIYSSERMYEKPLVYQTVCKKTEEGSVIHFRTQDMIRSNNAAPGQWVLKDTDSKEVVSSGNFSFVPFWRPTEVTLRVDDWSKCNGTIFVGNQWGIWRETILEETE